MSRVVFLPAHRQYTGGIAEIELQAADFRALVALILERFPTFPSEQLWAAAIAIDGEIVGRPLLEPLGRSREVIFLPRIAAG